MHSPHSAEAAPSAPAWPSAEKLAQLSCRCARSVQRAVRELETTGWIAVQRRTGTSSF